MHYKNGRESKIGDKIVWKDWSGNIQSGTIVWANPGSTTCNLAVVPSGTPTQSVTAADALHTDDVVISTGHDSHVHYIDTNHVHSPALLLQINEDGTANLIVKIVGGTQQVNNVPHAKPSTNVACTFHYPHERA